jgi:uncharacterized protein YqeY
MMLNKIQEDMKQAMRNKDKNTVSTLRMFISRIQGKAKDLKRDLTDSEIVEIGQKFKSELKEEFDAFYKVQNGEKIAQLLESENLIASYLPKPMSKDDVKAIVDGTIEFLKINTVPVNIGSVMKIVSPMLKGKADGSVIKEIVAEAIKVN